MKEQEEQEKKEEREQVKDEKLPLDAKLLSEAIIEFNISRRSVSLYPPGHAVITGAIERAFGLLEKLFELRSSISLGIAGDSLFIDEYVLDKHNPVYKEVAEAFYEKGIAAVAFHAGLTKEELNILHELLTSAGVPNGKEFIALAADKGLHHLRMNPIDYSSFRFVEDKFRSAEEAENIVWEDYVYGLLEGKLVDSGSSGILMSIPPERVAEVLNQAMPADADEDAYDRVITSYIRKKGEHNLSSDSLEKLFSLTEQLKPELKAQFLSKSFDRMSADLDQVEKTLNAMAPENFRKMSDFFGRQTSMIPDTLKNLVDKLSSIKTEKHFNFDMLHGNTSVVHDIELGDEIAGLFDEDHFQNYVSDSYKHSLDAMLTKSVSVLDGKIEELRTECTDSVIDRTVSEIMIETLDADTLNNTDFLNILTRLTEISMASTLKYFFQSDDFITRIIGSLRVMGRKDREEALRLVRMMKVHLVPRLMDSLEEENEPNARKFLLALLADLGSDILPEVIRRLRDDRWYVKRNMLHLLRSCGTPQHTANVKSLLKHEDPRVTMEALRTLLHFQTPDSIPHLRVFLRSGDDSLRQQAVQLCGANRVREGVPHLIDLLRKKDRFGHAIEEKFSVVKALGDIGDTRALDPFVGIMGSTALFRKRDLDELKLEILRNVGHFPPEALKPLLQTGQKSSNGKVRHASAYLMKKLVLKEKEA
jgi:HEAT repeat protein